MFDEIDNEFINRFLAHTRKLQDNMIYLDERLDLYDFINVNDFELVSRAMKHDLDKLEDNLRDYYLNINKYYYCKKRNIPCKKVVDDIEKTRQIHHTIQRHHFYYNNIDYNIIDICEMCSDIDSVYSLSSNGGEKNNKTYFNNYMLSHFPKLLQIKDLCLKIFDILEYKKDDIKNVEKASFIDSYIKYVRNFQDYMIKLDRNRDKLFFNVNKWEITRIALNYNKDDFDNVKNIDNDYFEYNKNKYITNNNNINKCCLVCNCYSYYGNNFANYIDVDKNVENIISIINS